MAGESNKTKEHRTIKKWAEERGGEPAIVKDTKYTGSGVLRITFPGFRTTASLEKISWERFFEIFDGNKLTFLYQKDTKDGKTSRFFKFIRW